MSATHWPVQLLGTLEERSAWRWRARVYTQSQALEFDDDAIVEPPSLERWLDLSTTPHWAEHRRARLRLVLVGSLGDEILKTGLTELNSPIVELEAQAGDAWTPIFRGGIIRLESHGGQLTIEASEDLPGAEAPLCPVVSLGANTSRVPAIIGTAEVAPVPLFEVDSARLRTDLHTLGTTVLLDRAVDWAVPGVVQVQDEVIVYTSLTDGGRALGGLTRSNPRIHRVGAALMYRPEGFLNWALAAHPANPIELRAENRLGALLDTTDATDELVDGGRTIAIYRRDTLPVASRYAQAEQVTFSALDENRWAFTMDSNVLEPADAVRFGAPRRGAVFSELRPILQAVYTEPVNESPQRFDQLLEAALILEFSNSGLWTAETRLRVLVEKGTVGAELLIARDGMAWAQPVDATAEVDPEAFGPALRRTDTFLFDLIEPTGPWEDVGAAAQMPLASGATFDSDTEGLLVAGFRPGRASGIQAPEILTIHARIRNTAEIGVNVMLRVDPVDAVESQTTVVIDEFSTQDLRLDLGIDGGLTIEQFLAPESVYTLGLPDGGQIELLGFWIEVTHGEYAPPPPGEPIPIQVTGGVALGQAYSQARLDLSALLPAEDRWQFFTASGGELRVTIELIDPPPFQGWVLFVRGLRWERRVLPATAVRPTINLWARVEGMASRADGTSNPATLIREILLDSSLGNQPEEALDADSFEAAAALCDARNLAFRRVYTDGRRIADLIAGAVGESVHSLYRIARKWCLIRAEISSDDRVAPLIGAIEAFEHDGAVIVQPGRPREELLPDLLATPAAQFVLRSRWASTHPPRSSTRSLVLHPRHLSVEPGLLVATGSNVHRDQGRVSRVRFEGGRLTMDLDAPRPIRVALHLDQASVFVAENRWLLRFVIDGRMVAELTASGDLRLAGNLVPEGHYPNGPLFQFDGSNGSLSVGTASGDGFSLSASGDLRTELPVFEEADPGAPCSDPRGIQIGAATFLGGTPGGGWAMRLDEDGIHLRGRLLSSYPFIP